MINRIKWLILLVVTLSVSGCAHPPPRTLPIQDRELITQAVILRSKTNATLSISRSPRNAVTGFAEGMLLSLIDSIRYYGLTAVFAPLLAVEVAKTAEDPEIVDQVVPALQSIFDPNKLQSRLEEEIIKAATSLGHPLPLVEPKYNPDTSTALRVEPDRPILTVHIHDVSFGDILDNLIRFDVDVVLKKGNKPLLDACYRLYGAKHRFSDFQQDNLGVVHKRSMII